MPLIEETKTVMTPQIVKTGKVYVEQVDDFDEDDVMTVKQVEASGDRDDWFEIALYSNASGDNDYRTFEHSVLLTVDHLREFAYDLLRLVGSDS